MPLVFSRLIPALILGLFLYVAYIVMTNRYIPEPPLKAFTNFQEADAPLGLPTGAFTYNAQTFWETNKTRGGRHTGDDINGIGGQNSDLGDPVFAIGNGLVIYSGTPSPGWGKTIILAHRTIDQRIIHSMYAHLHSIDVAYMNQIPRGAIIGTVGNANNNYLAHLHLEIRQADGISPQRGYTAFKFDRLNPEKTIASLRASTPEDLSPSVLKIIQDENKKKLQLPTMDSESALRLQEFLNKKSK